MELIAGRYEIVTHHGEFGTVFYIVDTWTMEEEQPDVVASWIFRTEEE